MMMTRRECIDAISVLVAGIGREFPVAQVEVWLACLRDLPLPALQHAVRRWLCEHDSGFPSIAAIRRLAAEYEHGVLPTAAEAWASVLRAMRRFGYYRSVDAMESLDPITREAVQSIGWGTLCDSTGISVQAGQFRRAYEQLADRAQTMQRLPESLRPVLSAALPRLAVSTAEAIA